MSKAFGEHLRKLRKTNTRYTQQDMADMLKISRSTYTYYETGKSEPSQDALGKLCAILKTDFNTLLTITAGSDKKKVASKENNDIISGLSNEEEQIILMYRRMNADDKDFLQRQITNISKHINRAD